LQKNPATLLVKTKAMRMYSILSVLIPIVSIGQNPVEAERLVQIGIESHDKGDYKDAIIKYDQALKLDKNNLLALSEKAITLNATQSYAEAVEISRLAIGSHKNDELKTVYVAYANSLDHLNQTENAIKVYDEGLLKYPNYYQLHFNKGITLVNSKNYDAALLSFQNAVKSNPNHASSFNAIGILEMGNNRIPSILALSRFLILENQTSRAKGGFENLKGLLSKGVSQKDDKSISIVIDPNELSKAEDKKSKENNFSSTDLILSLASAQDYDKKNEGKSDCEKFIEKFKTICSSLSEMKKGNSGFYWDYIVPYFIDMNKNKMIEPFAYIVFYPTQSDDVLKWHKSNEKSIAEFNNWSNQYKW
jgi:tetratricopeptide (TPR) repeat protein